jgi:CRISPR/Cas system-associated exonuclease Cas4 (RecB family)
MKITSLSPSMVNTYRICPRRFFYGEVAQLPYLPGPDLAFGASFHETARENYWQKRESREDLPIDLLTDFFCKDLEYKDVDWSTKSRDAAKDEGVISIRSYMQKIAPGIQPERVEHSWTWRREGKVTISGKTDLIATGGGIRELKTTGKQLDGYKSGKPKPKEGHSFQVATYVAARREETDRPDIQGQLDYSVRGKDVVCSIPMNFNGDLSQSVLAAFDDVVGWIEREAWPPSRHGNYLCSRKYCDYWNQCEKDCGGRVKD